MIDERPIDLVVLPSKGTACGTTTPLAVAQSPATEATYAPQRHPQLPELHDV